MSGILPKTSNNSPGSPPAEPHQVELRRRNSDINVMLQLPYYHPFISNIDQILHIMAPYGNQSGHFLLRNSFSRPGTYTVSLTHSSGIKHISIATSHNKFFLKDKPFLTMRELIDYYSHVPVPNEEYVENVMLQYPITRDFDHAGCDTPIAEEESAPSGGNLQTMNYLSTTGPGGLTECSTGRGGLMERSTEPVRLTEPTTGPVGLTEPTTGPVGLIQPSTSSIMHNETYKTYYNIVKETKGLANRLIRHLQILDQMVEDKSDERCECGLFVDDSRLPHNWSVHVSREPVTYGRIFFLGPDGNTTWELPMKIAFELAPDQQDRLRDLLRASDNYVTTTAMISQRPLPAIPGGIRSSSTSSDCDRLYGDQHSGQSYTRSLSAGSSSSFSIPSSLNSSQRSMTPIGNADYGVLRSPPCDKLHPKESFFRKMSGLKPFSGKLHGSKKAAGRDRSKADADSMVYLDTREAVQL